MAATLVAACFLVASCLDRSTAPPPPRLRIASWNLEHLAERDGEGCRPRTADDYRALSTHAQALAADVVAFQEVESRSAAERVFTPDRWNVVIEDRSDGGGGGCRGLPGQSLRAQKVGFAIRKGLRFTRHDDLSALGLGRNGLRWGVDLTVDAAQPIRLLAIHLKSGCNSGRAPTDTDCDVLFQQLPVLEGWIDARALEPLPFAVLGDWNRRLAARGDAVWTELDDKVPANADLSLASGTRGATCKARFREFIDFLALDRRAALRVVPDSFAEYTYGLPEASHPSDHCPVSVSVELAR